MVNDLPGGHVEEFTFTWDTTDIPLCGNYTFQAKLPVLGGEIQEDWYDNVLIANETALVYVELIPGDLDGSGKVDWKDLLILARAYGSDPTKPNWDPRADIDGNGKVDWKDLLTLARNYGKTA